MGKRAEQKLHINQPLRASPAKAQRGSRRVIPIAPPKGTNANNQYR